MMHSSQRLPGSGSHTDGHVDKACAGSIRSEYGCLALLDFPDGGKRVCGDGVGVVGGGGWVEEIWCWCWCWCWCFACEGEGVSRRGGRSRAGGRRRTGNAQPSSSGGGGAQRSDERESRLVGAGLIRASSTWRWAMGAERVSPRGRFDGGCLLLPIAHHRSLHWSAPKATLRCVHRVPVGAATWRIAHVSAVTVSSGRCRKKGYKVRVLALHNAARRSGCPAADHGLRARRPSLSRVGAQQRPHLWLPPFPPPSPTHTSIQPHDCQRGSREPAPTPDYSRSGRSSYHLRE